MHHKPHMHTLKDLVLPRRYMHHSHSHNKYLPIDLGPVGPKQQMDPATKLRSHQDNKCVNTVYYLQEGTCISMQSTNS